MHAPQTDRMQRWQALALATLAIGALAGLAYAGYSAGTPAPATPVVKAPNTVAVTRGTVQQSVNAPGLLVNTREAAVGSAVSARIASVLARAGDRVKAGETLATLEAGELTLSLRNSEQTLLIAQAGLSRTLQPARPAELDAAQAALLSAQANVTRVITGSVAERNAASAAVEAARANRERVTSGQQSELAAAQAAFDAAQANLNKLRAGPTEADLAAAKAQLGNAEASLKQAQFGYDNAFRRDPAGIGASPAALQLEQATNNFRLATANHDKVLAGFDESQQRVAEQQLAAARAGLERFSGLNDASNRAAAEQQLAAARANLDRFGGVNDSSNRAAAWSQVLAAQATLERLQAGAGEADVLQARAQLALAQVARDQAATMLARSVITAPFDGVLLSVSARQGDMASPGGTLFVLADPAALEARVNVVEEDLPLIHIGQVADGVFDALSDAKTSGRVLRIVPQRLPGDRPMYPVHIGFDALPAALQAGMTLEASIISARRENVLVLPRGVVRISNSETATIEVWQNGMRQRREIRLGLRGDSLVEVIAGVTAGEQVVLR